MLKRNLKLFLRNIKKDKTTFLINIIGLSTGLATVLLIYLWVSDELNMDKFLEKDDRLFTVVINREHIGGNISTSYNTPDPLAKALLEEIPEVDYATSVNSFKRDLSGYGVISYGNNNIKTNGIMASEEYFHVFSHKLVLGSKDNVLTDKNGIVVSEGLAKKLFNTTENIVGRTLLWNHKSFKGPFRISGVFENPPSNSTSQFDVVFNFDVLKEVDLYAGQWNSNLATTYLIVGNGTNIDDLNKKITNLVNSKLPNPKNSLPTLFVQQYSKRYLHGNYENGVQVGGRIEYVRLFSIIAIFILFIACINFMNLSTAQASKKMKQIGVKKILGARRRMLVVQFLWESVLMAYLSLVLAIALAFLILPQFNAITGKNLDLNIGFQNSLYFLGIVLITGIIAGSYPAFYLSTLKSITILKSRLDASLGELWIRRGLVVFQFSLSIIFIVGVVVIDKQIEFAQTKNLGYDRDNVISFFREGSYGYDPETFLLRLEKIPGVISVANMPGSILDGDGSQGGYSWSGKESDKAYNFKSPRVGYNVVETLGIELIAGRSFSRDYKDDDYSKIMLNESAVKLMELEDPVGKIIGHGPMKQEIIGVVKDFQYGSLYHKVEPLIFRFRKSSFARNTMVKIKAGTEKATIAQIEDFYEEFHPEHSFEFSFLDDDYRNLYKSESTIGNLSNYFAGLAILISCMGLLGLATFTAERRRREISIRKVLGQTALQVSVMLSSEFAQLVLVSIFIALPVSYLFADNWLSGFAYQVPLRSWYFLGAGLAALLVALLTVWSQTVRAANMNPVEGLRDE